MAALRKALPDTVIDDVNLGTDGAWRIGNHYETIARMFATGIYEPFEDVSFESYTCPVLPGETGR